jgi:hypothetical protein
MKRINLIIMRSISVREGNTKRDSCRGKQVWKGSIDKIYTLVFRARAGLTKRYLFFY